MHGVSENCLVALTLSAVCRLHAAFQESSSPYEQQRLLVAAGDILDRTIPFPALKAEMSKPGVDQVAVLVAGRLQIAAVPPGLWRPARVRPNELSSAHYTGVRALERALRKDFANPERMWTALSDWLSPVWVGNVEMAQECQELKVSLGI